MAEESNRRLDSWKEIADYLGRDVRTVTRWEKSKCLPVHRIGGVRGHSVFALTSELDAWLVGARVPGPGATREADTGSPRTRVRSWVAVAGLLATLVVVAWIWLRSGGTGKAIPFGERDWILLTEFEDRTNEQGLGEVVQLLLKQEVSNSSFVNVMPPERVVDALRLMKKPADSLVDVALGMEICRRDGAVRALISGDIHTLSGAYVMSVRLIAPSTGAVIAALTEEAIGGEEVLSAARTLAIRVREKLGEKVATIERSPERLEAAATSSLRALRYYSHALRFTEERKWPEAIELLERAVQEDPDFASAHIYLAHCYANSGKSEEAAPHFRKAFALSEGTPDRERYFIRGSCYQRFFQNLQKAAETYEVLLRLYPDDYWATNNLIACYEVLGDEEKAEALYISRSDLRPNDFRSALGAAMSLAGRGRSRREYQRFVERSISLRTTEDEEWDSWFRLLPAQEQWLAGDVKGSLATIDAYASFLETREGMAREIPYKVGRRDICLFYLTLGRIKDAERHAELAPDKQDRCFLSQAIAVATGDTARLRERISGCDAPTVSAFLIHAGLTDAATEQLRGEEKVPHLMLPGALESRRGALLIATGHKPEGISLLQDALPRLGRVYRAADFYLGCQALVEALRGRSDPQGSLRLLEEVERKRARTFTGGMSWGFYWLRNQAGLAEIYREVGRFRDAERVEAELRRLLGQADTDHPLLLNLDRFPNATAATRPQ